MTLSTSRLALAALFGATALAAGGLPVAAWPQDGAQRTVTTRTVTGRVVDAPGAPQRYTVKSGDTLERIAKRLDTTIEALAKDNDLKSPYRLQPGQVLEGPRRPAKAYVVAQDDTLFAIARRFSVSVEALRSANGLSRNAQIAPGRRLRLPAGYRDRGPIVTTSTVAAAAPSAPPEAAPSTPDVVELEGRPLPEPTPTRTSGERTVVERAATGRVITIDTPGEAYRVKSGDTLEKIAGRLDSNVRELARINGLKSPYRLQPGQTIRGPGASAKAYVTVRGDSLDEVARRFSVTEAQLRAANGLRRGASLSPGRRLKLPAGYRDRGPIVTTTRLAAAEPTSTPPISTPRTEAEPTAPVRTAPPPPSRPTAQLPSSPQPYVRPPGGIPGAPVATPLPGDAQIVQMGRGVFAWPLRGEVISGFGVQGRGQRNDGLKIRARAGEPIRAAASGEVVYAGDQVPGFGNLVLIKHADGWVTAYGHLSGVDVRMQQRVAQGQQIGGAGMSGGVTEPQLHFEIRYAPSPQERAKPIDPALVLPK
jgi:murein DD-endopeptidase MepM/ murein hydrolase activator NlpD